MYGPAATGKRTLCTHSTNFSFGYDLHFAVTCSCARILSFGARTGAKKPDPASYFEKIPRITLTTPTLGVVKGKPPPNSEATWSGVSQEGLRELEQELSISRYCFGSASRGGFHAEQDAT